jgi:hypothetical protein
MRSRSPLLLLLLCCLSFGCRAAFAGDLVSDVLAARAVDNSVDQDVTQIVRAYVPAGMRSKDALGYLTARGFSLFESDCKAPCTRSVLAVLKKRRWYYLGFDEIRVHLEIQNDSVTDATGHFFRHTL